MIPVGHSWCGVRFRYVDLFSRLLPQLGLLNGAFERVQGAARNLSDRNRAAIDAVMNG